MKMGFTSMKMGYLLSLLLCSSVNCQQFMKLLPLHDPTMAPKPPMAVQLETQHLKNVSNSVIMAESWLRDHVLSHYPSTNITTIVVGHPTLCSKDHHYLGSLLPSLKNLHHSLTRWGLQNDIKLTVSLPPTCSESQTKPLTNFLREIGSIYEVTPEPSKRKLMLIDSMIPFPPIKTPSHSPSPAYAVGSPLPPLIGTVTPPPESDIAPVAYGPHPPCEPSHGGAPAGRGHHGVWCVAKPSVPAETLQEALDYACGEGEADCGEIQEEGSCYFPDNVVAHASYAFNSYWQKTKGNGGTCGFGGTAMLISSDPSYAHCKFILT